MFAAFTLPVALTMLPNTAPAVSKLLPVILPVALIILAVILPVYDARYIPTFELPYVLTTSVSWLPLPMK